MTFRVAHQKEQPRKDTNMSKICIYGAGAIGGFMAARLHEAGAEVSLIARGPHRVAIGSAGWGGSGDGRAGG